MCGCPVIGARCLVLIAVFLAGCQSLPSDRQEIVKAGSASLMVTVRGQGEPIVFIPARGRGVEDFDDLGRRLAWAGYQVILPQPRGIGNSSGPLEGISLHDLAADVAGVIRR